jgi:tetratricopeptide (TPR) repeat protein
MKNNMKKLSILFLSLMVFVTSCDLEVEPEQSIDSSEALNTSQKVESAVIGLYSILGKGSLYGTNFVLLPELIGAESNMQWRGTFQSFREVGNKNMLSQNAEAQRTWIDAYNGINLANNILGALDVVDEDLKDQVEGEARFVRGILYFELVRLYGRPWNDGDPNTNLGVPLVLTPTVDEETAANPVGRESVADVYAQVIDDLETAEGLLPEDNEHRATTWSASAFLARVYLQQGDFANARDKADRVIADGPFNLNPTVTSAFLNDNTAESIFEIQQNDQNNAGSDNDGLATFFASFPGIGRGDVQVLSYYSNDPEDYVFLDRVTTYDLYEDFDTRKTDLFYIGTGRRPGRIYSYKWNSPGQNIPIIRLAEMYLIRAEGNLEEGTAVGADPLDDVNIVRERAQASTLDAVSLDDVYLERRLELAYEGLRGHDVKRLGLDLEGYAFDDDLNTYVLDYTIPFNDDTMIFPIPQREIDANSAIKDEQNPGY